MIRNYEVRDHDAVLAINEVNVPEVGEMDSAKLAFLLDETVSTSVVEVAGSVLGFMVLLGPGGAYGSPNYRWFSERHQQFTYVDRIAVLEEARGQGWGPALYDHFESIATASQSDVMCAEVNTVPANPRSLRFHEIFGFEEVARCQPYDGSEEVAMLEKRLKP